jgi:[ribosomal protein S18]-alanine N-acetyltransferase
MKLTRATVAEAEVLAQVHAQAFPAPWRDDEFEDLLEGEGIFGYLAGSDGFDALILCRVAEGEMEVLTLAVSPAARRTGLAKTLIAAALDTGRDMGAREAFLEVATDNAEACALYSGLGFGHAGLRRGYYDRGDAGRHDAHVMRLALTPDAT